VAYFSSIRLFLGLLKAGNCPKDRCCGAFCNLWWRNSKGNRRSDHCCAYEEMEEFFMLPVFFHHVPLNTKFDLLNSTSVAFQMARNLIRADGGICGFPQIFTSSGFGWIEGHSDMRQWRRANCGYFQDSEDVENRNDSSGYCCVIFSRKRELGSDNSGIGKN